MKVSQIYQDYLNLFENQLIIQGWIVTIRKQKDIIFIKLNDGSHPNGIQLVIDSNDDILKKEDNLKTGSSIKAEGILIKSPAAGQLFELKVDKLDLLGNCDGDEYPLSKSKMTLEYLRNFAHLRFRTNTFGSVFRIKSAISQATHQYFKENGFFHLDPNIITTNECEGGAGVFQITEKDISIPKLLPIVKLETTQENFKKITVTDEYDWNQDHFGKPVYLTVSSQLQLEAIACALGSVYTTNKSFRSEHSSTNKHLSEFTHLEIETCFIDLNNLMDIGENYIKYVANYLLTEMKDDLENLNKFVSKGLIDRINDISKSIFYRISYEEAINISIENGKNIKYGDDLSSEVENFLTEYYKGPVFVYNWPIAIKSFYMKQDENDDKLCNNFDLLMPYKIGELIGGSMREDDYDKLLKMMNNKGIETSGMKFYTDLRKFGSVPHGGFGLGFDRLTMLFTGMENIKDTVPFPISYKNCLY